MYRDRESLFVVRTVFFSTKNAAVGGAACGGRRSYPGRTNT